ncbi:hypothetical protein [Streptomyces sp. NPDC053427]|uniref:hypothetical protein n=1 Tax=Streptomyces sp. NPDC053427 TaxID=3365701 RepID=UPI0037D073DD
MLQFSLGKLTELPPDDPAGRPCAGWREGMAPEIVYALNRGCWQLGEEAAEHTVALYASTGDGIVRLAVEIARIVPMGEVDGKPVKAIEGRVLQAGHPVHDRFVGRKAPAQLTQTFRYVAALCGAPEGRTGKSCGAKAKWIVSVEGERGDYIACGQHITGPLDVGAARFQVAPLR